MYRNLKESEIEGNLVVTPLDLLRQKISGAEFELPPRLDDAFLSRFLHLRRGNVEEAIKFMQNYYRSIKNNMDYVGNERPSNFVASLNSAAIAYLRHRSEGHPVLLLSHGNYDTTKLSLRDTRLSALFQAEYVAMELELVEAGIVLVFDFAGITLSHLKEYTYNEVKRGANFLQDGLPARVCQIHFCNVHPLANPIITLAVSFLSTKLKNRVFVHNSGSLEEFHRAIDPKILPKSLGGQLEDEEAFDWPLIQRILRENVYYEEFWNPERTASSSAED